MPLFRVRYMCPWEVEIESESSILAEIEAAEQTHDNWIAEHAEDEEDEDA